MQVNLMHHPGAFASLDAAFDPATNALYAARFLNSLYGVSGSWVQATAAYHSETPAIGADYQRRVMARWQMPNMNAVSTAYGMFASRSAKYADFAPTSSVYGDFSGSYAVPATLARR
jgi:soluble lytic murein transglycosylase-like protein